MSIREVRLCCFGAGGHGRVVATQWQVRHGAEVVFADNQQKIGTRIGNLKVVFQTLADIREYQLIVTIGDNQIRENIQKDAERNGMLLTSLVSSPDLYFSTAPAAGSVVLAGAVVNCGATIGRGVIVNSAAVVEHDATIGDFSHISPNATLAGGVRLGNRVSVGAGATILPGLDIASDTVIGGGAVVVRDIVQSGTYVGVPAKRI